MLLLVASKQRKKSFDCTSQLTPLPLKEDCWPCWSHWAGCCCWASTGSALEPPKRRLSQVKMRSGPGLSNILTKIKVQHPVMFLTSKSTRGRRNSRRRLQTDLPSSMVMMMMKPITLPTLSTLLQNFLRKRTMRQRRKYTKELKLCTRPGAKIMKNKFVVSI